MSDNEEIVHQKVYSVDWDNSCRDKLAYFKKQGMPDLAKTRPEEVFKMKRMYLGGSTYREVAMTFHKKLPLVLFLSEREKWYQEKVLYRLVRKINQYGTENEYYTPKPFLHYQFL